MPRRTQQAEVWLAGLGEIERLERAADAAKGVVADAFVVGGVAVEIVRLGQALESGWSCGRAAPWPWARVPA